jgi:threonyl-tRNA synthetase
MLQRIYGTVWATQKQLDDYLHQLAEAEKRDHRQTGPRMGLFHFSEEAPGSVFWHPKGWRLFMSLVEYLRKKQEAAGYQEINTPDMMHLSLWERSGHWEKFGEHMFVSKTEDDRLHALKPMNCPGHVEVFKWGQRSYRELPLRFSEFGKVHRYEPSGALHGAFRVRHFTQDDAHVFCTHEQVEKECTDITKLLLAIYKDFGFEEVQIKLADRPEKRVGSDEVWRKAEAALEKAAQSSGIDYVYNKGEGAFYGPKLEFVLRDCLGRDWQCGTVQLDFNLPERLGATYIDRDGTKQAPVMIHRALFGSLERFAGILLEHYEGWLPMWLAPTQVVVAGISNAFDDYAAEVKAAFSKAGLRAELDIRNEKINYKVQFHAQSKVPVLCAVGGRDRDGGTVALRRLKGGKLETLKLEEAVALLKQEAEKK